MLKADGSYASLENNFQVNSEKFPSNYTIRSYVYVCERINATEIGIHAILYIEAY